MCIRIRTCTSSFTRTVHPKTRALVNERATERSLVKWFWNEMKWAIDLELPSCVCERFDIKQMFVSVFHSVDVCILLWFAHTHIQHVFHWIIIIIIVSVLHDQNSIEISNVFDSVRALWVPKLWIEKKREREKKTAHSLTLKWKECVKRARAHEPIEGQKKQQHTRTSRSAILSKRRNALGKNGNSSGNDLLPEPFKIQTKGAEYTHTLARTHTRQHDDSP